MSVGTIEAGKSRDHVVFPRPLHNNQTLPAQKLNLVGNYRLLETTKKHIYRRKCHRVCLIDTM